MLRQREPRVRDLKRLEWLRTQPCVICGAINTEACHIRVGSINHGKRNTGMAEKPSDRWTVSMCNEHHREQHSMEELSFWKKYRKDPFMTAIRQQPSKEKNMTINAHIDRQKNKTIDGVTFTNTHSGQKKAYGDSYYEYDVTSDLPAEEVERVCSERVYKAMAESKYLAECKVDRSADAHFRAHYKFQKSGEGHYFYQVCYPHAD